MKFIVVEQQGTKNDDKSWFSSHSLSALECNLIGRLRRLVIILKFRYEILYNRTLLYETFAMTSLVDLLYITFNMLLLVGNLLCEKC